MSLIYCAKCGKVVDPNTESYIRDNECDRDFCDEECWVDYMATLAAKETAEELLRYKKREGAVKWKQCH